MNSEMSDVERWKCRRCGAEHRKNDRFCDECGTPRDADLKAECPNCGAKLDYDARLCNVCNTYPLEDCPRCGAKFKPNARYCGACGAWLREGAYPWGAVSLLFVVATIGIWVYERNCRDLQWLAFLQRASVLTAVFGIGSGCMATIKNLRVGFAFFLVFILAVAAAIISFH